MVKRAASQAEPEAADTKQAKPSGGRGRGRKVSTEFASERQATKADMSNFITTMKHRCSDKCKMDEDSKMAAAQAIENYNALDANAKQAWVARWKKDKKDLSWMTKVRSGRTKEEATSENVQRGMMTKYEIFDLCKVPAALQVNDNHMQLLEDLLRQSERDYKYETKIEEHSNADLTRYYFVKGGPETITKLDKTYNNREDEIEGQGGRDASASSGLSVLAAPVKKELEPDGLPGLRDVLVKLRKSKATLAKKHDRLMDLFFHLVIIMSILTIESS